VIAVAGDACVRAERESWGSCGFGPGSTGLLRAEHVRMGSGLDLGGRWYVGLRRYLWSERYCFSLQNNTFKSKFDKDSSVNENFLINTVGDTWKFQLIFRLNCLAVFTAQKK
jgi:hypothetical protein